MEHAKMIGFSRKSRVLALAGLGFLLWVLTAPNCSWGQDGRGEGSERKGSLARQVDAKARGMQMQKHVTKQANFVLYVPKGWTCKESVQLGFRTLSVRDPSGMYEATMSYGINPAGNDVIALARFFHQGLKPAIG